MNEAWDWEQWGSKETDLPRAHLMSSSETDTIQGRPVEESCKRVSYIAASESAP
jgi:hypothetical protein